MDARLPLELPTRRRFMVIYVYVYGNLMIVSLAGCVQTYMPTGANNVSLDSGTVFLLVGQAEVVAYEFP
jgi:hypothetical protein